MQQQLPDPFYYLGNFERALTWVSTRYDHLLDDAERRFAAQFPLLPQAARALLVRMVMRKGSLFRASKLVYPEIGCPRAAVLPLAELGWIDPDPALTLDELFALLTKPELARALPAAQAQPGLGKAALLEQLRAGSSDAGSLQSWWPECEDAVYRVLIDPLCERIRLLFFGNGWQGWTEFVLADLGIYRYEQVELSVNTHGFRSRTDIDIYLHLQQCRERLGNGEAAQDILTALPSIVEANPWMETRRARLLFAIGQQLEREQAWEPALDVYAQCTHPGARARRIRMLERLERCAEAHALALEAQAAPESEAERQQLARMLPRLCRALGLAKPPRLALHDTPRIDLVLPQPDDERSVEHVAAAHFAQAGTPVCYVENALFNSLFGLLCWRAIFAPVPGAFFHPFQAAPADLHSPDFRSRRIQLFADCLAELDDGRYLQTIRHTYAEKHGIVSPFVFWSALDEALLELALACIPPAHLKACFERMLFDLATNCSGFPDLIQFFPAERRYRLIEVKGPGDRLQDNQVRWLEHFARHEIPAEVCYVQWQ